MSKSDGGSAFPAVATQWFEGAVRTDPHLGMSLRDYFAIKSLASIIVAADNDATRCIPYLNNGGAVDRSSYAQTAYQYADAMLAEREKP